MLTWTVTAEGPQQQAFALLMKLTRTWRLLEGATLMATVVGAQCSSREYLWAGRACTAGDKPQPGGALWQRLARGPLSILLLIALRTREPPLLTIDLEDMVCLVL